MEETPPVGERTDTGGTGESGIFIVERFFAARRSTQLRLAGGSVTVAPLALLALHGAGAGPFCAAWRGGGRARARMRATQAQQEAA